MSNDSPNSGIPHIDRRGRVLPLHGVASDGPLS